MSLMNPLIIKHNIKALPTPTEILRMKEHHFGRYIDFSKQLKDWRSQPCVKRTTISQKRKSLTAAISEFRDLYNVKEYYASFGKNDDSFEVYYIEKAPDKASYIRPDLFAETIKS